MGSGKTLTQTYLGWKNWWFRHTKLYSNYHLYTVPYYYLETVKQLDYCREGVVLIDEIWKMIDSRLSRKASNKIVGDILGRSRKRSLVYIMTSQVIDAIDKRVRKTCDFSSYPVSNRIETTVKVLIFRTGYPKAGNYMKTIYYNTSIPFSIFDSHEEIDMIDDTKEEDMPPEPRVVWQEAKYKCNKCGELGTLGWECQNCESRDLKPIEPIYFNSWEEADAYAQKFWETRIEKEKIEVRDD